MAVFTAHGQLTTTTSYDFTDGSIITAGQSTDGLLTLSGNYSYHSSNYGLNMKVDGEINITVNGSCTVRFLGSQYSSLSMEGSGLSAGDLGTQSTTVTNDLSDTFEFVYTGPATTLNFKLVAPGSDLYLPLVDVIPTTTQYDFRDGTIISAGQSADGLLTLSGNHSYHSTNYGLNMKLDAEVNISVSGSCTVRFVGSQYSSLYMQGSGSSIGDLGTIPTQVVNDRVDTYEFTYSGGPITLNFKAVQNLGAGSDVYLPILEVIPDDSVIAKTDVWDFGAEELDPVLYNNMLDVSTINSFYTYVDPQVPGESGRNILSFTAGDLGFMTNGTNDRLRTTNENITRWDGNIANSAQYTGRLYINSGANLGRYLTLNLNEDDEVTIEGRTDSGGVFNFEYAANPAAQTDQVDVPAAETTIKFVAKSAGEYRVFDTAGKPSYFRVYRKAATYQTITGLVDETNAAGIPGGYSIEFTNEAGKTFSTVVSGGNYSIDLPIEYTYSLSLGGANGYIITNGLSLGVTENTSTYDIVVAQVDINNVSGNIVGLTDLSNLNLIYTPDSSSGTVYNPIVTINQGASTYSVDLEVGIEYKISAEGVNDYEILANTITTGTTPEIADVTFSLKPVYSVAINAIGLNSTQQNELNLTFTNLNEAGYEYTFTDITNVALRDGVYSVSAAGLDLYPVRLALTSNLTVASANTLKDLTFNSITEWTFNDRVINSAAAYEGLIFTGSVNVRGSNGDLNAGSGATIAIPVSVGEKVIITDYYASNYSVEGGPTITNTTNSTSTNVVSEYVYPGSSDGMVTIAVGATSYFVSFKVVPVQAYSAAITVGTDKDFQTINDALDAISRMDRPSDEPVTVLIDPGNYEEMLVIESNNITLKNAATTPSIALANAGVDIDPNAVRITSYYGQKYNFFSQATNNKWSAEALAVNIDNGYTNYVNKEGTGGGSSYWNATIVVTADDFTAEDIIIENSFNQYISFKESQDVVQAKNTSSDPTRPTDYGNTAVQNRGAGYVTQAAAIGIASSADRVILNKCRVIGRQDSFYGAQGARVAVYKGAMMGAVDYLFGGMNAVFYQTDLVLNTSDTGSDAAYITAAQQTSGRGFLMYECHVKSPIPGVETASVNGSKPGYFGRPWAPTTSEVVFYNTTIDESTFPGSVGLSLISPVGWTSSLGGESPKMYEFGTIENASGIDNSGNRTSWSTVLGSPALAHDGTEITTFNFTKGNDDWDPIPSLISQEVLGIDTFTPRSGVSVKAYHGKIFVSNVKSKTQINVYNLAGALIKSLQVKNDTNFNLIDGFWIVKVQDNDGQKTIKLICH